MMGEHPQLGSAGMSDENDDCKKEREGWLVFKCEVKLEEPRENIG
jgi:hypothetical protein